MNTRLKMVSIFLAMVLFFSQNAVQANEEGKQYTDLNKGVRQVNIGLSGINDSSTLAITSVLPFDTGKYSGWGGAFVQQQTVDGELASQLINIYGEVGYEFSFFNINAFSGFTKDTHKGTEREVQIGGFIASPYITRRDITFRVGAGNFLENKEVREDLELADADPNVTRWFFYSKAAWSWLSLTAKVTPQVDLSDFQAELHPVARFVLKDNVDLVLSGIVDYESTLDDPVHTSYLAQLGIRF